MDQWIAEERIDSYCASGIGFVNFGVVNEIKPALWKESVMIKWAIIFFVASLIAGFFGFTGVAAGSRTIAKVLFFVAIAIFLVILIFGVFLGRLVF